MNEPATQVIAAIARAAGRAVWKTGVSTAWHADPTANCAVFSYRRDFATLWGAEFFADDGLAKVARNLVARPFTIYVVWDGEPDLKGAEGVGLVSCLSPLDWAVALGLTFLRHRSRPPIAVRILDLHSHYSTAFSKRFWPFVAADLPWVRVFSPARDAEKLVEDLLANAQPPEVPNSLALTRSVRPLWVNELARPEGRHSVSNLVAPVVLASGLRAGGWPNADTVYKKICDDGPKLVFAELLRALDLISLTSKESLPRLLHEEPMVKNDVFERFKQVRWRLVDDQAKQGFERILNSVLATDATNGRFQLEAVTSPDELLTAICSSVGLAPPEPSGDARPTDGACETCGGFGAVTKVDWEVPRVVGAGAFDILLLDLRLFPPEQLSNQEASFLQGLLNFYHCSGLCDLKIEEFAEAIAAAKSRLEKDATKANYKHLILLTLLLAKVDPSLPIILFSSTSQRSLFAHFAAHPNVITDFSKPTITGYDELAGPDAYISRLVEALKKALAKHEERVVWLELAGHALENENEVRFDLTNEPYGEERKPEVIFKVERAGISDLASQCQNTVLQRRFADALMEPKNWLEARGIGKTWLNEWTECELDFFVFELLRYVISRGTDSGAPVSMDELEIKRAVALIWEHAPSNFRLIFKKFVDGNRGSLGYSGTKELAVIGNILNRVLLEAKFDAKGDAEKLDLLGLPARVAASSLMAEWVFRVIAEVKSAEGNWGGLLQMEANGAIFAVLAGLRNARAHYLVRPSDDEGVREIALFSWLWLLGCLFGNTPPLIRGSNANVDLLLAEWCHEYPKNNPIVMSGGNTNAGRGRNVCRQLLAQVKSALDLQWFAMPDYRLKRALSKILDGHSTGRQTHEDWLARSTIEIIPEVSTPSTAGESDALPSLATTGKPVAETLVIPKKSPKVAALASGIATATITSIEGNTARAMVNEEFGLEECEIRHLNKYRGQLKVNDSVRVKRKSLHPLVYEILKEE